MNRYVIIDTMSPKGVSGLCCGFTTDLPDEFTEVREILRWEGAMRLFDLAANGPDFPEQCHLSPSVGWVKLTGVVSQIQVSEKSKKILESILDYDFARYLRELPKEPTNNEPGESESETPSS